MITLGGIIGASLFVGSGNVVRSVGPAAVLSYLFGGLLVFLAMRMLGEMAAARPVVGSFMEYAREGLGDWAAYIVGWLYWYFWVGVIAFEAVVGGSILNGWFPGMPNWLFSVLLLLVFTATNLISLRSFGEVEFWLASVRQATSTVIWRILLFFVGGVLIIVTVVPWNQLPNPKEIAPFAYIFGLFGLPGATVVMTAVILTAVCSVLNSGLYSAARMFAALADDGFAPGIVAKRARGVPYVAVLASTLGGYAAVAVNFAAPATGIFDFIMNSAGLVALFVYAFIALTQMRLRDKMTAEQRDALKLKMWLHPWLAILVIAAVIGVVVVMLFDEAGRVQVWTSLISVAVLIVFWPMAKRSVAKRAGHFEDIVEDLDYGGH